MKVLYSSKEIRDAVNSLFAAPVNGERRVALVAYIGAQASQFLPDPKGLEIICALEPGATSARALELLKNNGARIRQSNRLHMKVYFSSARGAVICSANASSNGLSGAGLKEAGVLVDAQEVDIAKLIEYANPRSILAVDLKKLELAGDQLAAKLRRKIPEDCRIERKFAEWESATDTDRCPWKIQGYSGEAEIVPELKEYGIDNDRGWNFILNTTPVRLSPGDWVLCFDYSLAETDPYWMYIDHVVKVHPGSTGFQAEFDAQAVQIGPLANYAEPPFTLDLRTKEALFKAIEQIGVETLDLLDDINAPKELIEAIRQYY